MLREIQALVIDDSTTMRRIIMSALRQTGLAEFVFAEAADGRDALDKFCPGQTQLLFVDMNMPRMNGLEFIRELRKRHADCPPAVMITAESNTERLKEAVREPGVAAFLLKPVDRDRLRSGLKTLIDSLPETSASCAVPHGECVPQAVQQILAKACGLQVNPVPVEAAIRRGEILLSIMSVVGAVQWSVELGFAQSAAQGVASRFAGSDVAPGGSEMGDAIGELSNIVGGRIKLLLSAREVAVNVSLPTVLWATNLQVLSQPRLKTAVAKSDFESEVGRLWSTVALGAVGGIVL